MAIQNPQQFFVGLKAFIEKDGKLLIIREVGRGEGRGGNWELPGGRINVGEEKESLEFILRRELQEELGNITFTVGNIINTWTRYFELRKAYVFLLGFHCTNMSGEIKLSNEHSDLAWVDDKTMSDYNFVPEYADPIKLFLTKK